MKLFLLISVLALTTCKTAAVRSSGLESAKGTLSEEAYLALYNDVEQLQTEARAKYAALQSSGLTSESLFAQTVGITQGIAAQFPGKLDPTQRGELYRSVFTDDFTTMNLNDQTKTKINTFNTHLTKLEDFFSTWDRFLFRRAYLLTAAHWRAVNAIYIALPDSRQKSFTQSLNAARAQYQKVYEEIQVDESGMSVFRTSYVGPRNHPRANRLQGAQNEFAIYFTMTNKFLEAVGADYGITATLKSYAKKVKETATLITPMAMHGNAVNDLVRDISNGNPGPDNSYWDDFYYMFKEYAASLGGSPVVTGFPLPQMQGKKVLLPANSLAQVGEAGYSRTGSVDVVLYLGNHEHPMCVTFAPPTLLSASNGLPNGTFVTTGMNAFVDGRINIGKLGPKIFEALTRTSDVFSVQDHGLAYPGQVSESLNQFRQAMRANKRLIFLFPQGDNPHGHGGESTRLIPTNAEFLPRLLSRLRETGEIRRFAIVPYGFSSLERILYDSMHRPVGADTTVKTVDGGSTVQLRFDVGHTLLDYEVETLMNLRYRRMLPANVPSALTRMLQYSWVEEAAKVYKGYPAGVVDISQMIRDLIVPSGQIKHASNIEGTSTTNQSGVAL